MAFEGLSEKLQSTFKKLRGKGKLNEKDIKEAMREVKLALLEADVNYKVVKNFVSNVSSKCVGGDVLESLTPGQQVIKIVNEELTNLMGGSESKLNYSSYGPTVIMLVGLQGAGKTTMCGKLALQLRKDNKKPLLVACDIYRPAAIKQLQVVGKQIDIPVFTMGDKVSPVDIA
ncbi:MAG: signal recognition particle receptor subunit alpha, partial [Clostridium sp.]|nr:signal recognition particle receptor subunit alpha [Clostridium sp.]MDU2852164.1 signal recognition particle receptor subunit alpha [Clostridium sp.]